MEPRYMVIQMDTELVVGELVSENKFADTIPVGDYVLKRAVRVREMTAPAMTALGRPGVQTLIGILSFVPSVMDVDGCPEITVPVTDKHWRCFISKEQYEQFRKSFRKPPEKDEGKKE